MNIQNLALQERIRAQRSGIVTPPKTGGDRFADALAKAGSTLRFSSHARSRLKSRNINVTPEIMSKLDKAVRGAEQKGSKDSLILLKDLAFIVSVKNRTVVTAMDGTHLNDNIVTNIDSTVLAE
ncbi:MAG: hypothetical protein GF398_10770 [Chitinivibrionales bacterium]|nr:hypothetical protein [Chitinivibrionales bacterium]